jgi:hypothetical protein
VPGNEKNLQWCQTGQVFAGLTNFVFFTSLSLSLSKKAIRWHPVRGFGNCTSKVSPYSGMLVFPFRLCSLAVVSFVCQCVDGPAMNSEPQNQDLCTTHSYPSLSEMQEVSCYSLPIQGVYSVSWAFAFQQFRVRDMSFHLKS